MNNLSSPSPYRQTTDYNCGPAALAYMLRSHESPGPSVDGITAALRCTPDEGTCHEEIERYLRGRGYAFSSGVPALHEARLPMLVNYHVEDDGHYGVLLDIRFNCVNGSVRLFDPSDGRIVTMLWTTFSRNWFSPRYGKFWGLWDVRLTTRGASRLRRKLGRPRSSPALEPEE